MCSTWKNVNKDSLSVHTVMCPSKLTADPDSVRIRRGLGGHGDVVEWKAWGSIYPCNTNLVHDPDLGTKSLWWVQWNINIFGDFFFLRFWPIAPQTRRQGQRSWQQIDKPCRIPSTPLLRQLPWFDLQEIPCQSPSRFSFLCSALQSTSSALSAFTHVTLV